MCVFVFGSYLKTLSSWGICWGENKHAAECTNVLFVKGQSKTPCCLKNAEGTKHSVPVIHFVIQNTCTPPRLAPVFSL